MADDHTSHCAHCGTPRPDYEPERGGFSITEYLRRRHHEPQLAPALKVQISVAPHHPRAAATSDHLCDRCI